MKKYGIDWIQPKKKRKPKMLILGSITATIVLWAILAIIAIVIVLAVLGFVSAMLPYLIVGAVIIGLGYVIYLVAKQPSYEQQSIQQSSPQQEIDDDIVATCKSMYDESSTIKECIKRGGRL